MAQIPHNPDEYKESPSWGKIGRFGVQLEFSVCLNGMAVREKGIRRAFNDSPNIKQATR
jgi:hypothetical protein